MTESTETTDLSKRVHEIIQQYVYRRTEDKARMSWQEARNSARQDPQTGRMQTHPDYRDARLKVCQDAFLAIRARRARQEFVAYFTGTICSVPQFLPLPQYQLIAQALLGAGDEWEDVKALAMLSLSALSDA